MTKAEIRANIEQVKNYINDCERRIAQGESVDLTGLDQKVESICNEVAAIPNEEGKQLEENLLSLFSAIDKLANAMHDSEQRNSED